MSDENTAINSVITGRAAYNAVSENGKTYLINAVTGRADYVIDGDIGGGVKTMTTAERTAITPDAGELIYDSDDGNLYIGDGVTPGGNVVSGGGGGGGVNYATVSDIMTGSGALKALNVQTLRGALTSGQAVDVTSQPDGVTGDYKGTFSVSGSLGFASFPKFASGLSYLMLADLTATTSGTVTPSGTWLDGTTTAKNLSAGTSTRVAMLFNAADKGILTFSGTGSVSVSNCREYEVTACTDEAINYIASLSNPDAFAAYYLIKPDMVQPWTYIIDMGSSPAVTIASGLAYKLNASTGTHQLTVDTCPVGYNGRDATIRITLGGSGIIQAVAPLQLGGALTPYAVNNCTVKYRDGEAILTVDDVLAGYIVTVNSGTVSGSLPYGLAASNPYIAFSPSTDGAAVDLSGVTTYAEEKTIVGNGYSDTILTGGVSCTSKTTFANLTMSGVSNLGGTMTLGDVYIPNGATVSVGAGGLIVEKVTGNGGTINLGGKSINANTYIVSVSGCTITGGSNSTAGGAFYLSKPGNTLTDCVISGNSAQTGGAASINGSATTVFDGCTIIDNWGYYANGGGIATYAKTTFSDCVVSGNKDRNGDAGDIGILGGTTTIIGGTFGFVNVRSGGSLTISSGASFGRVGNTAAPSGFVTISSGASINLTSSIAPGGTNGIQVVGGTCTVNGNIVESGTYTSISSNGTTT